MTFAKHTSQFLAPADGNRASTLEVCETPWGYVLRDAETEDSSFAMRVVSGAAGASALLFAALISAMPGFADLGLKLGFALLLCSIGILLVRFARQPGTIETEIDFDREEIRVVSQTKARTRRRVLASTRMHNIKEYVLARTDEGSCLAFREYTDQELEVLAIGNILTLARLKARLEDVRLNPHLAQI
ncbi:MAG: hypothetical protein AAGD04_00325 [Pseudomonadota bacterium]